nr:HopJ type III effector protein [uncultured Pedobacter sp.]
MTEKTANLLANLKENKIQFSAVIETIDSLYNHTPTAFKNGEAFNEATQNQGSAKVFSFAKLNNLSKEETLLLFAEHYQSVLNTPEATDHQNIRQFMQNGWQGIRFEGEALSAK